MGTVENSDDTTPEAFSVRQDRVGARKISFGWTMKMGDRETEKGSRVGLVCPIETLRKKNPKH